MNIFDIGIYFRTFIFKNNQQMLLVSSWGVTNKGAIIFFLHNQINNLLNLMLLFKLFFSSKLCPRKKLKKIIFTELWTAVSFRKKFLRKDSIFTIIRIFFNGHSLDKTWIFRLISVEF